MSSDWAPPGSPPPPNQPGTVDEADEGFSELAGRPLEGGATEAGGMPAIEYEPITLSNPERGRSKLLIVFDDDIEYLINCQATPEKRQQLDAACAPARPTLARR